MRHFIGGLSGHAAIRTPEVLAASLSAVLGVLLLSAAALGPLMTGRIRFHMSADAVVQYVGGEIVTVLGAVLLLASVPMWSAARPAVPGLVGGLCAYVVYTFVTVVAGQEFDRYEGNAEKAFLLYAAITAVAVVLVVTCLRMLTSADVVGPRQATAWLLLALAVVIALLRLGQLAGLYRNGPSPEYETATSLFWLIKYLDLAIVIPLIVLVALRQHAPSAGSDAAAVVVLGFVSCLFLALFCMALEMLRRHSPGASGALAIGALVLLVPSAVLWVRWLVRLG